MRLKVVNVTNPRNVLVQIPSFVVSEWGLTDKDKLEVSYEEGKITIRPVVCKRERVIEKSNRVATAARARRHKGTSNMRQIRKGIL